MEINQIKDGLKCANIQIRAIQKAIILNNSNPLSPKLPHWQFHNHPENYESENQYKNREIISEEINAIL